MPLGRCGPSEEWDRPNYQHQYCLRSGVASKQWNQPDWGYCRQCPQEIFERHKLKYFVKDNPLLREFFPTLDKALRMCTGSFECDDGKVCIDKECSAPPPTVWNIET